MPSQLELLKWNLQGNNPDSLELRKFELDWLSDLANETEIHRITPRTIAELKKGISDLAATTPNEVISEQLTLPQFKCLISEFAPDGLTEAFAMCSAIPRLQGEAQASVMRILMDEFGRGNQRRQHSELFRSLLSELNLPTSVVDYTTNNEESYAFVNLYHWLTKRATKIDYYLGALAFSEMVTPGAFQPFLKACERLGIRSHAYFAEHIKVDLYHTKEAFRVLEHLANRRQLDLYSAYLGASLAKLMGDKVLQAALRKSISGGNPNAKAS